MESPEQLLANPLNWRIHPQFQQDALKGVLDEVGWVQQVIVNKRTGHLIDGHLRVTLSMRNGADEIPVNYVDLSEEEERLVLATLDPLAGLAVPDTDMYQDLIADLEIDDDSLNELLSDIAGEQLTEGLTDPDEVPELPTEPTCKTGDLVLLGEHRLLCGDSMSDTAVEILMGLDVADMVFTDPPYNVDYGVSKKPRHKIRSIENDKQTKEEWAEFCTTLALNIKQYSSGDVYVWGASAPDGMRQRLLFVELGFHWSATIIWKKQQLVLSPAKYQRMYEPCLYGWFDKSSFGDDRKQTEVWEIDRPLDSKLHPTMKPVELCERGIKNSSKHGDIVLDLFGGSGSTLIACEQTNRKCYMMEIDPHYCDVIIQRWENYTGEKAEWHDPR